MSKQVASFDRSDRGPSPIELFVSSRQVDSTSFLGRGRGSDRNRESIVAEESLSRRTLPVFPNQTPFISLLLLFLGSQESLFSANRPTSSVRVSPPLSSSLLSCLSSTHTTQRSHLNACTLRYTVLSLSLFLSSLTHSLRTNC